MSPQNALLEQKKALSSLTVQVSKGLLNTYSPWHTKSHLRSIHAPRRSVNGRLSPITFSSSGMQPALRQTAIESTCNGRTYAKNQGTKMVGLGRISHRYIQIRAGGIRYVFGTAGISIRYLKIGHLVSVFRYFF